MVEEKTKKRAKAKPVKRHEQPTADHSAAHAEVTRQPTDFGIVGIGASAGGLEALRDLLDHLPADTGMALVQQPQSADYAGMPASTIATGLAAYVLPPALSFEDVTHTPRINKEAH